MAHTLADRNVREWHKEFHRDQPRIEPDAARPNKCEAIPGDVALGLSSTITFVLTARVTPAECASKIRVVLSIQRRSSH